MNLVSIGILCCGVLTVLAAGAGSQAEQPAAFTRVCGRCHAQDRIVQGRRLRSQWDEVVDRMIAKGATGTDEDFEIVLDYLMREFGRVAVNSAAADEVAIVLHLDTKDAEAIVAYRNGHGPFADFDALAAMPGAPVEALKKRRDAIVF